MKKNKKWFLIFLIILFSSITIYACYKLIPLMFSLRNPQAQENFKNYINEMGWKGWWMVLLLQVLQIFIAFIPGEIIEILSGVLYGTVGGLFLCLLGIFIGSILIYYTIKLFANRNLSKYKEKLKTYNFLKNPKKIHIYFFLIFLIPGIPKDIFIYLVPFLPIRFVSFLIISLIARIPTILSSTIIGNSFVNGNYLLSLVIFSVFAVLGILGILFHDKIIKLFKKDNNKSLNNNNIMEN